MQIVIDIADDDYNYLVSSGYVSCKFNAIRAIRDGIVLPKGHGRLIDADKLKEHKYHDNHRHENAVAVCYIDWEDTIIEADKRGETT